MGIICKINKNKLAAAEIFLTNAVDFLLDERIIVFPMESIYAFGGTVFSTESLLAFQELFQKEHPFIPLVLVDSIDLAKTLVTFNPLAEKIAKSVWPGNLAMTLPKNTISFSKWIKSNPDFIFKDSAQITVQISNDPVVQRLLELLKQRDLPPIILATPAFIPNQLIGSNTSDIVDQFGHDKFALILDTGKLNKGTDPQPNTIIDLTQESLQIIQPGSVDVDE